MSNIDILRKANAGAVLESVFQIPVGDGSFMDAKLTAPDAMRIWEESDLERRAVWAKAEERGLVGKPINRAEWEEELAKIEKKKDREAAKADPPKDQAEQFARKFGGLNVIRSIIPKYLKGLDGEPLFRDEQECEDFVKIMFWNQDILKVVSGAYVELTKQMNAAREAVKN